ncbi:type I secretion C-terminal target domain-containing protein, partial [Photobacterium sp. BZF1]|uniref:type I secretion C-terminal target domain-containing protein n=1 Tax=Photobacterium sp. BZF1 TaxID=1904457 RepID=UPI00165353D5
VLKVRRIESDEDEWVDLKNHITLTSKDDLSDGSETLYIQISDLPDGAILSLDGSTPLAPDANGVYEIAYSEIEQLQLKPGPHSNVDFSFDVKGVVKDTATHTAADGITTTAVLHEHFTQAKPIEVALTGVADMPDFEYDQTSWTELTDGRVGLETTIEEDTFAYLDFSVLTGEAGRAFDDESETLSLIISGIPDGVKFEDTTGNEQSLVYVGTNGAGEPKYELKIDSINDFKITPPLHSTDDITLDVTLVVTEDDGDSQTFGGHLVVHVEPVIDAANYEKTSTGREDSFINLDWQPPLADDKEVITGLVIKDLPADFDLYIGNDLLSPGGSEIVLSQAQLTQITTGGEKLRIKGPEDSDVDILEINTVVTVYELDVDSNADDEKLVYGKLDVDIRAVVESDGQLAVVDNNGAAINILVSDADGVIDIPVNTTGDQTFINGLSFVEDDLSSAEVIQEVVITLVNQDNTDLSDQSVMNEFFVQGGINNGDGSWTIFENDLADLQIIAKAEQTEPVYVRITAEIRDLGDNNESDESSVVVKTIQSVPLELTFNGFQDFTQQAGNIVVDTDDTIIGEEDVQIPLGEKLEGIISVDTSGNHHQNDDFTLVIDPADLPTGASLKNIDKNHQTGEYVLNVPVAADGSLDFSSVQLILPPDYAGDFTLDVKYVTTDTQSGDVKEFEHSIPFKVSPVVDEAGSPSLSVVQTDGLGIDKQPVSNEETDYDHVGIALEDGDITLDLSVAVGDSSTTEEEGLETVGPVTLTVDGTKGVFIDPSIPFDPEDPTANQVTVLTLAVSELDNIQFRPVEDFSGTVSVGIEYQVTDKTEFNLTGGSETDMKAVSTNASFAVIAVNDPVEWVGIDSPAIGQEDAANGTSLAGIGGSLSDIDGSEEIISVKITGVPDDFIIQGAANNSQGEWNLTLPAGKQTSFNLDDLSVIAPKDFSGQVNLNVVVYSKEASLADIVENTVSFVVDIQPFADRVDTDIETEASGTENDAAGIELLLNVEAFDDELSYEGAATNVVERAAEGLMITLSNVPDSSSIALPNGVVGTVTDNGSGEWVVTVDAPDFDKLIFHPGDANNVNWDGNIGVNIRAVDNGDIATDSIDVNETIHVDVAADNDAPVNMVPTDLTVEEDVSLLINTLRVTDVDVGEGATGEMTVTLNVGEGTLAVASGFDWNSLGLTVDGNGLDTLVITGSLQYINDLLEHGVEYTGDLHFNGVDTLAMVTNDQGNSGAGPVGGLSDSDLVTITVTPVNDAPENTVPSVVTVEEDDSVDITGLQVSDVDYSEAGSTGAMTVTLEVTEGSLTVIVPTLSGVMVSGQGSSTITVEGTLPEINDLLGQGVKYEGDLNFSGDDELTITTYDGGNVGSGTQDTTVSKVPVKVTPKADAPTLSLDSNSIHTAAIRASLNTAVPLTGLMAALTDASELLTVEVRNLGNGQLVDGNGLSVGQDLGAGVWQVSQAELADLHVIGLTEGENVLEVIAISEETDSTKAESLTIDIQVVVDDLEHTNNQIGSTADQDGANLVIDSDNSPVLLGGAGDDVLVGGDSADILVGGAGDDILWGGEQNGTGDGAADIFKWNADDFGTAGNVATDKIMDFEVGIDKVDLVNALSGYGSMSLTELSEYIKLSSSGGNSVLSISNIQGNLVQNIIFEGVTESALLMGVPTTASDEDKLTALLNNGHLEVGSNFGNKQDNIVDASDEGDYLYGLDGEDILTGGDADDYLFGGDGNDVLDGQGGSDDLVGGEGDDSLSGGNDDDVLQGGDGDDILTGDAGSDLFTWDEDASGTDIITDFTLSEDQLDLSEVLSDGGDDKFTMDDLLAHTQSGDLTDTYDDQGDVNLTVKTEKGNEQKIILKDVDSESLDPNGASSNDIIDQLFSHNAFKVDPDS